MHCTKRILSRVGLRAASWAAVVALLFSVVGAQGVQAQSPNAAASGGAESDEGFYPGWNLGMRHGTGGIVASMDGRISRRLSMEAWRTQCRTRSTFNGCSRRLVPTRSMNPQPQWMEGPSAFRALPMTARRGAQKRRSAACFE